ncbi:hypothetical protein H310_07539 [Aphanomyces invadans]|uniref:Uncharacterized protein n=1 Tax=Aphanomyces invadans TaxID=157072 RepID=A0A024U2J1_9STRA|nr:hypothetical protein H310_07539 [Aphanomyces invadans]ETW00127.1 hypothetical protein H310_07539 [Aphanomyces invadans]|eukprot:XP_008871152.1 hypothetical protein H310_07539 [Aphanomyces invadans]
MDEELEQKMTFVLADIDAQFSKAHEAATQLLRSVRRHSQTTRQMHAHCRLFHDLFVQLQDQAQSASHSTPRHCRRTNPENRMNSSTYTDIHEDIEVAEHYDSVFDADDEFVDAQLATTTLVQPRDTGGASSARLAANSANFSESSINISTMDSQHSPLLHHTSTRPPVHLHTPSGATHQPNSHKTPASPGNSSNASYGHLAHLPSPDLPSLSNRVQLIPPSSSKARGHESDSSSFLDGPSEITTPDVYVVSRPTQSALSPTSNPAVPFTSATSPLNTSAIVDSSPLAQNTVQTPQWHTTPGATSDLRRRFSAASDFHTPVKSKPSAFEADDDDEMDQDVAFPHIDSPVLASPLLSTKLKVITPHTPLSNRIAGASTEAPYRSPYASTMLSSPSTPKIPIFDLALFPVAFQKGEGAYQMTRLYSHFRNNPTQAMTLDGLLEKLDDCESERLEILLDTLVSRRLLRPFVVEGEMYWQASLK